MGEGFRMPVRGEHRENEVGLLGSRTVQQKPDFRFAHAICSF